jgi:hypothetical protein
VACAAAANATAATAAGARHSSPAASAAGDAAYRMRLLLLHCDHRHGFSCGNYGHYGHHLDYRHRRHELLRRQEGLTYVGATRDQRSYTRAQ